MENISVHEYSKSDYLAQKAGAVKKQDAISARIAELEAAVENVNANGSLQNGFVSTFEKYADIIEVTSEIVTEAIKEVRIFPDKRIKIIPPVRLKDPGA